MDEKDAEYIIEKIVETAEDDNIEEEEEESKGDDAKASYLFIILFYFMGTASFAPHNFYVTANEYWMYKFRDPTSDAANLENVTKTVLQKNFTAYATIANNVGMITFLILLFLLHKKVSLQKRIVGSMSMLVVLFGITLLFIFVDTDTWQEIFFCIALGISALLSSFSAVLLVSLFQLASRFPPRCLVAQLAGQNICGILAALIQIIALAAEPSVTGTATLYYGVATATIASIIVFYLVVVSKSKEFCSKLYHQPKEKKTPGEKRPVFELAILKKVLSKLALLIVAMVLSVACSGILHPGLTALIESTGKGTSTWSDTYFIPVCVYLLFNTFEFIGREVSNHIEKMKNIYIIFVTSVLRSVLLPLILLCNLQPRSNLPVVFHDDAFFIGFMILLSITGGYLANIGILVINKYCEPEEKTMGTLFIVLIMIVFVPIISIFGGTMVNVI